MKIDLIEPNPKPFRGRAALFCSPHMRERLLVDRDTEWPLRFSQPDGQSVTVHKEGLYAAKWLPTYEGILSQDDRYISRVVFFG